MNEKIKELSVKANEIWLDELLLLDILIEAGKEIPEPFHRQDLYLQKFAELIVRECIRAYNDDGYQTEYEQDQKVLKHFGIEK
jgi:hypothetical protein